MRFSSFLTLTFSLALASALGAAGTETFTPTLTPSESATFTTSPTVTVSPTVTPGPGNWSLSFPGTLVYGQDGYTGQWTYTAGQAFVNGLLTFSFPPGIEAPVAGNFFVQPSQGSQVSSPNYSGQDASFTINSLAAGASLTFWYGYNANGFAVGTTSTPLGSFVLAAHPTSLTLGAGVVTPVPLPAAIVIVTRTVTPTVTPTSTITTTFTPTPTITQTSTITQTFTETPLGAAPASGVYSYPNPFDLRKYDKCTFRFQPVASAEIQVFNLVGEPVRRLEPSSIQAAQGWAVWNGDDDYLRRVTGGLYFVRIKTPNGTLVRKFTVLH